MDVEDNAVFQLLDEMLGTTNISDFLVFSFNDSRLLILGSFDLAYYHEIEIAFEGVSYIGLPAVFDRPRMRFATPDEAGLFAFLGLEHTDRVFVIELESSERKHFVVAQQVFARKCMVYHYRREDLKPGEEIAPWVD
jgi:hypothetical protein